MGAAVRTVTPLGLAVLRLLCGEPMHPYQMRCAMEQQGIDRMVKVTHGALYHTVDRLAAAELIRPVETSRCGRRPERTVYAITESGREAATARLRQLLATLTPEYPGYRTALTFLSLLRPAEASVLLGRRAVLLEAELAAHQTAYDALRKQGLPRVSLLEVEHLIAIGRAELSLTRAIIDDLDSGRLTWAVAGADHGCPGTTEGTSW